LHIAFVGFTGPALAVEDAAPAVETPTVSTDAISAAEATRDHRRRGRTTVTLVRSLVHGTCIGSSYNRCV
jgi:hypothetical protein